MNVLEYIDNGSLYVTKNHILVYFRAPEPKFTIIQEPHEGYPEFLVAEIHLPNIVRTLCYNIYIVSSTMY